MQPVPKGPTTESWLDRTHPKGSHLLRGSCVHLGFPTASCTAVLLGRKNAHHVPYSNPRGKMHAATLPRVMLSARVCQLEEQTLLFGSFVCWCKLLPAFAL